jgi:hypothetical protein
MSEMTIGSISKAIADAKSAAASTRKLAQRVDDVDALIDGVLKSIEANTKALNVGLAKVDKLAKIDTSATLAKLADFESEYTARLHKASGDSCDLDEFRARIEADRAMFAKRDALTEHDYDDDGQLNVARCPPGDTRWRLK